MSPPSSSKPIPVPVSAPSMETLNDAMHETGISVEALPPKRGVDAYAEFYAEARRTSLQVQERFIQQLRSGNLRTFAQRHCRRKRVRPSEEEPDKPYPLFQCGRGHQMCMRCYEHHSKKCRYCGTTEGSVVNLNKGEAKENTNGFSCHNGPGWVIPNEGDFFCPDISCQFCGPLDSVLNHVTEVPSMTILHFSYGEVIRIPLRLVGKYVVLRAEDGTAFVLWVDDLRHSKMLSIVCAQRPSFCRTRFTFNLTYI